VTPIKLIGNGMNVAPLLWALQAKPELWNQHTYRTENETSPHHGVDDIWVRCSEPFGVWNQEPHDSVWYPSASVLPVKELVYPLMQSVQGDRLGSILITRVLPGQSVKPHIDPGWHARFYKKFAIQVQSAPGQAFCFDDLSLSAKPGEVYFFDNSYSHWVTNDSKHDRITMIVCIKTDLEF
tara:strand:- start:1995 stop:2537 length:543 start_codon:yes stop_codon:yes gene_type:complete